MTRETIVCVTPNAALDRTLVVPDFALGHISRVPRAIVAPGGKGLNVLRAVKILGGQALAMGLLGGYAGRMIADMVAADGFAAEWTRFDGETRNCTIIAGPAGLSTVINEAGSIQPGDWLALADDICRVAKREDIRAICLCGSLPAGAPDEAPADLIARLRESKARVWVDSSKRWLRRAIAAKPYAIKVNREELAEALDPALDTETELIAAAQTLLEDGIGIVVVSLGADGALLASGKALLKAIPPRIQPVDPVASGDCLLAGLTTALARGADLPEALRRGAAAGTANALVAGGARFTQSQFQRILAQTRVESLGDA